MTDYSDCALDLENESMLGLLERILAKNFLKGLKSSEKSDKLKQKVDLYNQVLDKSNLNESDVNFFGAHLNLYRAAYFKVTVGYGNNWVTHHLNEASKLFSKVDCEKNSLYVA
ncbi:hypothetical protein KY321_03105 [Candidatus Woesearchaeota archaeon]|nr:hypothetical protein [Candidatus Woesearchaeota archaeon]